MYKLHFSLPYFNQIKKTREKLNRITSSYKGHFRDVINSGLVLSNKVFVQKLPTVAIALAAILIGRKIANCKATFTPKTNNFWI